MHMLNTYLFYSIDTEINARKFNLVNIRLLTALSQSEMWTMFLTSENSSLVLLIGRTM